MHKKKNSFQETNINISKQFYDNILKNYLEPSKKIGTYKGKSIRHHHDAFSYIQNNNDYSISNERHIFTTASENARNAQTEEENNANNININKKVCICGRRDHEINNLNISNMMTTSNNELPIQTTDYEERERGRKEIISKVKQSRTEIREEVRVENEESAWTGDIFIQVMERLQYLAAEPPDLIVQFMNDLMIDRTVDNNPIKILIPIPDNFVQQQCDLMVLSKEKKETEEKPSESICPENVDFLNISHAYSTLINSFNDLESDRIEMFFQSQPKIEKPKPKPAPKKHSPPTTPKAEPKTGDEPRARDALYFNDEEGCRAAIAEVRNDECPTFWAIFGTDKATGGARLLGKGVEADEMYSLLTDKVVAWVLLRRTLKIDDSETTKFVFINWIGDNIPRMLRARLGTWSGVVQEFIQPYHVDINASSLDEITEDILMNTIAEAAGTKIHVLS